MRLILALTMALAGGPAAAQVAGETLADMRQELAVLHVELQRLKRELSTTGAPGTAITGSTTLERLDAIEGELRRLNSSAETLTNRIDRVVSDGTRRVADLEFRICELEPGCSIGEMGDTLPIGGEAVASPATARPAAPTGGAELAMGEQAAFDQARAAYEAGDYQVAADGFAAFAETYVGGPLSPEAHFLRGRALAELGQDTDAARAFLDSFSSAREGARAPEALLRLGLTLQRLGQQQEACQTLREVTARFPQAPASLEAQTAVVDQGCT